MLEAGGLDAILPGGAVLQPEKGTERSAPIDALTRSRRRLRIAFAVSPLDAEKEDITLLRLIDQASLDEEAPVADEKPDLVKVFTELSSAMHVTQRATCCSSSCRDGYCCRY